MDLITTKTITRIFWIAINLSCLTIALKDVRVTVPTAVKRGDNANLTCHYDLENDTLYSIKWYKGKREFYRYTPKEDIPMKVFTVTGITVERSMSNASNVMLISMEPNSTGKYSCEVSADAPTFHTSIVSGELEVVDLPKIPPRIDIDDKIYSIGNMLLANCTVDNSKPLANLTWLLNNNTLRPHEIIRYNIIGDSTLNSTTSVLGLKLVLQSKHFRYKNLRLTCKANIYNIYENETEKILELNTTSNQIYTDDFITIGSSRHTQYDGDFNGYGDPYDIRMHHMQASPDRSTSASSCSKCCSSYLLFFLTAAIILCRSSGSNNSSNSSSSSSSSNNGNSNSHGNNSNSNNIRCHIKNNNNIKNCISGNCNNSISDGGGGCGVDSGGDNDGRNFIKGNNSSCCYDIDISYSNNNDDGNDDDDSIQNIILAILLKISSFLFVLINWLNVHLKGLININIKENIIKKYNTNNNNNIQVLLSKSTTPSLVLLSTSSLSSSILLFSSSMKKSIIIIIGDLLTTKKLESSIKQSISILYSSFLFSIIIAIIILYSRIQQWSTMISLKYYHSYDSYYIVVIVDDGGDLLLVKRTKSNDICGYDIDSCYSFYNDFFYSLYFCYCCCCCCCCSCCFSNSCCYSDYSLIKKFHFMKNVIYQQIKITILKKYLTSVALASLAASTAVAVKTTIIKNLLKLITMIVMIILSIVKQMTSRLVIFVTIVKKIIYSSIQQYYFHHHHHHHHQMIMILEQLKTER